VALNLNVHFHSLVLDGVYAREPQGALRFHPLPPPDDAEVGRVVGQVARRIRRLLECRGLVAGAEAAESDRLADEEPLLAALYAASVAGRIATGRRAGQRVHRLGDRIDVDDLRVLEGERCASVGGVSLHANVAVPAPDRRRLERLCRYVARPPVATERLARLEDGMLLYRLKHRWRDGTTHVVFEPQELLEKLAALVPPPRFHLARYHGILGPCASERDRVVPGEAVKARRAGSGAGGLGSRAAPPDEDLKPGGRRDRDPDPAPRPDQAPHGRTGPATPGRVAAEPCPAPDGTTLRPRRLEWADLLRRVFAVDVLECPRCGGRMRLIAVIHPPEATQAILECLGLPSRAPPTSAPLPEDAGGGASGNLDFDAGV
jgi:hypothetical protein